MSELVDLSSRLGEKRRAENFPVALRVLPRAMRADLVCVYEVARYIDDLGDEAVGDRVAALEEFRRDLACIWQRRQPSHPLLWRLLPVVAARGLAHESFDRLVRANLRDQRVGSYRSFTQLWRYCELSAVPVGRIVLELFGVSDPDAPERSDRVCVALQLLEHWQDVGEDRRAGRVYLPAEDLTRFGVTEADLDAESACPALRRLIAFETDRAAELLESGAGLVSGLHGWARLVVGGYVAGGLAAVDALRAARGDVLTRHARARRRDVARHLILLLVNRRGRRR